uniref:hypothetical protein n=1 Tax=Roseibium sp. TaxID=1936156 RepID=UPI003D0EA8CF
KDQIGRMKEEVRSVLDLFGAKKKANGQTTFYEINYEAFVDQLGVEGALQVRAIIDEKYQISGGPGEKPKIKMKAAS